jgi:predicted DNA binding CopG/RHH family protein
MADTGEEIRKGQFSESEEDIVADESDAENSAPTAAKRKFSQSAFSQSAPATTPQSSQASKIFSTPQNNQLSTDFKNFKKEMKQEMVGKYPRTKKPFQKTQNSFEEKKQDIHIRLLEEDLRSKQLANFEVN